MADDKKTDDYDPRGIGGAGKGYEPPMNTPRSAGSAPIIAATNNPVFPILSYCASSILMTVTNKYVLSGFGFNLNFFLLAVQVCFTVASLRDQD